MEYNKPSNFNEWNSKAKQEWGNAIQNAEDSYLYLLRQGVSSKDANGIYPVCKVVDNFEIVECNDSSKGLKALDKLLEDNKQYYLELWQKNGNIKKFPIEDALELMDDKFIELGYYSDQNIIDLRDICKELLKQIKDK